MHLALTDLYRAKWTDEIQEEWISNLLANRKDLPREKLERTRALMNQSAEECLVEGYQALIPGLELPDPDDRHVLAAAIKSGAAVIVTFNLEDFPSSVLKHFDIEAQHPDTFVGHLLDLNPALVCTAVKRQRANLRNPAKSINEFLACLEEQQLTQSVKVLRGYAELL